METAEECRAEAARLRRLTRLVSDRQVVAEMEKMIEELEHRARELDKRKDLELAPDQYCPALPGLPMCA